MPKFALLFIMLLAALPAHADIGGIGITPVDKDVFTAHFRSAYTTDEDNPALNDRLRQRLMTDYGVTDDYAVGVYAQWFKQPDDSLQLDALILEQRFELAEAAKDGYYSGFRLRYTYKDGDKKPDNAHIRLLAGAPVGNWDFKINQIIYHDIGQQSISGLGLDTRLQATYGYHPRHRFGIESFSDFGRLTRQNGFDAQSHTIGPVFLGKLEDKLLYEVGYRVGVSDAAADHTFKLFLIKIF